MAKRKKTCKKAKKSVIKSCAVAMPKKSRRTKTINLRGKRYKFLRTKLLPKDSWGICTDPSFTKREIKVHKNLKGLKEFEVIVHEMLHACFWDIDEQVIKQVGIDISRALWDLGYRNEWLVQKKRSCK
jgi:hypothetical protein